MMNANISTDELRLLAYLHENATGYTEDFSMRPDPVLKDLSITIEQLKKDVSYLHAHGLSGMKTEPIRTIGHPTSFVLNGIWITGAGENYMREVEVQVEKKEPGRFKRIGLKAVELGGDLVKAVAVKVLTDKLSGH